MRKIDRLKSILMKYPRLYLVQRIIRSSKHELKRYMDVEGNPFFVKFENKGRDNIGKQIYVIDIPDSYKMSGYCHLLRLSLLCMAHAERLRFTPVIRWRKDLLYHDMEFDDEYDNCFEYFFTRINSQLTNIETSELVVYSKKIDAVYQMGEVHYRIEEDELNTLSLMIKKYLKFNETGIETICNECERKIAGKRVLGVHIRGTDFRENYSGHPNNSSVESYITTVKERFSAGMYEEVFLATDEESILERFKLEFGELLIYYPNYRSRNKDAIHYGNSDRKNHRYLLVNEILLDVYTLSKCNGLIAGLSNVSIIARAMKKSRGMEFDDLCILDSGINDNWKEFSLLKAGK